MKSVGVSIARLIDHFNCFELSRNCIFLSNLSLEDIGNLCFRVSGISNFGTEKEIGAGSEGEFSFLRLSPEGWSAEKMAAAGFPDFGEPRDGQGFFYDVKESDVSGFYQLKKPFCFLLNFDDFRFRKHLCAYYFIY